jgi:hypothetical protein
MNDLYGKGSDAKQKLEYRQNMNMTRKDIVEGNVTGKTPIIAKSYW